MRTSVYRHIAFLVNLYLIAFYFYFFILFLNCWTCCRLSHFISDSISLPSFSSPSPSLSFSLSLFLSLSLSLCLSFSLSLSLYLLVSLCVSPHLSIHPSISLSLSLSVSFSLSLTYSFLSFFHPLLRFWNQLKRGRDWPRLGKVQKFITNSSNIVIIIPFLYLSLIIFNYAKSFYSVLIKRLFSVFPLILSCLLSCLVFCCVVLTWFPRCFIIWIALNWLISSHSVYCSHILPLHPSSSFAFSSTSLFPSLCVSLPLSVTRSRTHTLYLSLTLSLSTYVSLTLFLPAPLLSINELSLSLSLQCQQADRTHPQLSDRL